MIAEKSDGMCIGGNQAFGIKHTINFKPMTTISNDYNAELVDQELTSLAQLETYLRNHTQQHQVNSHASRRLRYNFES